MYLNGKEMGQMLKNNAISQRLFKENPERGKMVKTFCTLWKIKQAEYFYEFYLKKLFRNVEGQGSMEDFNQKVQLGTKEYLRIFHPNLYDSGYDPMNTYDFSENQHLHLMQKQKTTADQADPKDFATRVAVERMELMDELELSELKRKGWLKSDFQGLAP